MDFTTLSAEQISDLAKPPQEFEEILRKLGTPDLEYEDSSEALEALRYFVTLQDQTDQKDAAVEEETVQIPSRDGFQLPAMVFRERVPLKAAEEVTSSPLIVLFYGGGFVLGSPVMMAKLARSLVKRFHAVVVAPTYRLAPEHPFPCGILDGQDALSWIAQNATSTLHAMPSKGFVVGGISAGGNITNVITHLARDDELQPPITGNWLSCPGVRLRPEDAEKLPAKYRERLLSPTQQECINGITIPPSMGKLFWECLKPDVHSKLYAPMIWPSESGHKGICRTYSQVCGRDTRRDDLLIYDDMLKSEGIETRLDIYPGLPHCFWHRFKDLPQTKKWEEDTLDGFSWLLES